MNRKVPWTGICLVAVAAVVFAAPVSAGTANCSTSPGVCDIRGSSTLLRSDLWAGACTSDALQARMLAVGPSAYPIDVQKGVVMPGLSAPDAFLTGVCEMHQPGGSVDRGLVALERAQRFALLPAQRQAAQLFEGILHCRKMGQVAKDGAAAAAMKSGDRATTEFCAHRSMAKSTFARMQWLGVTLTYAGNPGGVGDRLKEVADCSAQYLHNGFDGLCGVTSPMDEATMRNVVNGAASSVLDDMFGRDGAGTPAPADVGGDVPVAVVNPLRTLVHGRIDKARYALEGAKTATETVAKQNRALVSSVDALALQFSSTSGDGTILGSIEGAAKRYDDTVAAANDLLSFAGKWVNGLYEDEQKNNVKDDVAAAITALNGNLPDVGSNNELGVGGKLRTMSEALDRRLANGKPTDATVRRLCAVFFCELLDSGRNDISELCGQQSADGLGLYSDTNALCRTDGQAAARALCAAAGFTDFGAPVDADACVRKYK